MRTIIFLCLFGLLPISSIASESYQFQAKTRQVSTAEIFWKNFWNTLSGKTAPRNADLSVRVSSSTNGNPLRGALVMVGQSKGQPFANNTATTDANGMAYFTDPALQTGSPLTVTASLGGFGNFSIIGNRENTVELTLQPSTRARDNSFLQGKLTGFPPGYGSTELEMGMFMPAFRPESLLNFDLGQIVSSYKVEIDVYGKRLIPGNIVMPKQSKRYGIIPISIEKPEFIMPLPNGLKAHMTGIVGAVSIGDASDAAKAKDYLAILNMTELTHVGYTERMTVRDDDRFNLNAGTLLEQKASRVYFNGVGAKLDAVAISLFDPEGDREDFVPMDVKALKSEEIKNGIGSIKLAAIKQRRSQDKFYIFTGIFDRTQMSGGTAATSHSVVGSLNAVNPSDLKARVKAFLKPMEAISVGSSNREYRFTSAENTSAKITPDMVIVNIVSQKKNAETQGVTKSILWSAIMKGSADSLSLPNLGRPVLPNPDTANGEEFSWEVLAFTTKTRRPAQENDFDIQSNLRNLEHVSSLAKKF